MSDLEPIDTETQSQPGENFYRNRLVVCAYALGGACFAILLSGLVDADFCDRHPWIASWLAAAVPWALATAFTVESGFKARRWWVPTICVAFSIGFSLLVITAFFMKIHPVIAGGFASGIGLFLGMIYASRKAPWYERQRSSERDAGTAGSHASKPDAGESD